MPNTVTVAYTIRRAYPNAYDDLTDQQLDDAVRSKAPKLDEIVRKMIAAHESTMSSKRTADGKEQDAERVRPPQVMSV